MAPPLQTPPLHTDHCPPNKTRLVHREHNGELDTGHALLSPLGRGPNSHTAAAQNLHREERKKRTDVFMTLWTFWGFTLSSAAPPAPPTHTETTPHSSGTIGGFGLNNVLDGGTLEDVFRWTHDQ